MNRFVCFLASSLSLLLVVTTWALPARAQDSVNGGTDPDVSGVTTTHPSGGNPYFGSEHAHSLMIYLDNDNMMLGAVSLIKGFPDGNDLGLTHRAGVTYIWNKDHTLRYRVDVTSEIYLKEASAADHGVYERLYDEMQKQGVDWVQEDNEKIPAYYLDITRLFVTREKSLPNGLFYVIGFGGEVRSTDGNGSINVARNIQDWWHHKILNTYRFHYVPSQGDDGTVGAPIQTTTESGKQVVAIPFTDDHDADPQLQSVAKVSYLLSLGFGGRVNFANNRIEWEPKVGTYLSTEGKQLVGPNSYIEAGQTLRANLVRNKKGKPSLNATAGVQVFYFPTALPNAQPGEGEKVGAVSSFVLESFHRIGKRVIISPVMYLVVPGGRQQNQRMNDVNSIMGTGIKVSW